MNHSLLQSSRAFTLVELLISMSIFATLSVMILNVYFYASDTSRRLNAARQIAETAREITDRIAEDVRQNGINRNIPDGVRVAFPTWSYAWGSDVLVTGSGANEKVYIFGKRTPSGLAPCTATDKADPRIHCGLYLASSGHYTSALNLVDSFVPDENKKRVKIDNLRFYVSGGEYTSNKVTLVMDLSLMPRIGVPISLIGSTRLKIQTTLSERLFKSY